MVLSTIRSSEVSGLTQEVQAIEYREGSFPEYSAIKMPGIPKYSNVTLKRGILATDKDFFKWLNTVKMNKVERRDLTIKLLLGLNDNDVRFTEVSGLSVEKSTEEVAEGGENRFIQKYPTRTKYPELILKRGLLLNSEIFNWLQECLEEYKIEPKNIDVKLLNEEHEPLLTWHLVNAYPTKWEVSNLNASNNAVVIESLQFFYQYFTVDKS